MNCPEENVLVDFLRDELGEAARDEIEAHIDGCELCRAVLVELARFEPESGELAVTDQSFEPEPVGEPTRDPEREAFKVAPRLSEGDKVGRYVVLNKVGEGGMGVVYAAYDPELDRKVAIKLLMTSLTGSLDAALAEQRTRLLREAQAMAKLSHSNVITVHDVGEFGDQVFVAMEFVDGGTLTDWLRSRSGWRDCASILLGAGRGLAAAHRVGLVHRDFKPDNVLIDRDGRAVVTDFGLARPAAGKTDAFQTVEAIERTPVMSARLTRTGALVGTPAYMAPEQLAGQRSGALADQFSFCVTVYEGLYGQRPFEGRVLGELMANVSAGRIRPAPRDADVPRRVRRAIVRGLSVRPEDRFPTMEALLSELSRDPGKLWRRWAAVLLPASVLGVGLLAYQRAPSAENVFCADLDVHLEGVWDADRRASLEAAFLGTKKNYAESTWARTEEALDAYVERWLEAQRNACSQSASGVVPTAIMALRVQCLEGQRRELETLVGVLHKLDGVRLGRARDAVDALAEPSRCDDIEALARRDAGLNSAAKRATRRELDDQNARAFALQRTGDLERSNEIAHEALRLARTEQDAWSEAEALVLLAENAEFWGRTVEAEENHHAAMTAAISSGHDAMLLRVAVGLVWGGANPSGELRSARRWYELGLAASERVGGSTLHRTQLENGMATAYINHEQFDDAQRHAERALAIHEASEYGTPGKDSTWATFGRLYSAQGQLEQAENAFRRSAEATRERYGATHPFMADALENLGATLGMRRDLEGAHRVLTQALEVRRVSLGDRHPQNSTTLVNLSNIDLARGEFAARGRKLDEALAIVRESDGGAFSEADILSVLGDNYRLLGQFEASEAAHRAASELVRDDLAVPPTHRARIIAGLGRILILRGHVDSGRSRLEQAVSLVADEPIRDVRMASVVLLWAWGLGAPVPAVWNDRVREAVRVGSEAANPIRAAEAGLLAAQIAWVEGDRPGAEAHLQNARARLEPLGRGGERLTAEIQAWVEARSRE